MSILRRLLRLLGFSNMVRIEGKGFNDLSLSEAAEMIEVHLGQTGRFHPDAVYEFYTVPNSGELEGVRQRLLTIQSNCAEPGEPDGLATASGRLALTALAEELRSGAVADA